MKELRPKKIAFIGATRFNKIPYRIEIVIMEGKIHHIERNGGKMDDNIEALCHKFEVLHPRNFEDVASAIKLEMIKRSEYTMDAEA